MNTTIPATAVLTLAESLAIIGRESLINVAIVAGIDRPHIKKTSVLIEMLSKMEQKLKEPAVEAAAAAFLAPKPTPAEAPAEVEASNVIPFEASAPVEAASPAAPASESHGLFKVSRKTFQRQLAAAARITSASKAMPVLSSVLVDFADGRLAIEANDLSNHLRTETQAETTGARRLAIPHGVLSKFVSRCASEFLMAEVVGDKLVISDLENRTEIMGIPASEFPPAPEVAGVTLMEIHGKQLARVIGETAKAASTDETRYILNALGIDTKEGFVVATDGRRLVRAMLGADSVTPADNTLILPTHAALVLAASVPQDVTVKVSRTERTNLLRFATEAVGFTYALTTRLVEGRFPNYQQVIPGEGDRSIFDISNEDLNAALGRILVVVDSREKGAAIKFDFASGNVEINAVNVSVGTGKETLAVRGDASALPRHIAMNGSLIAEVIGSWADERINVSVRDEVSPFVIRTADKLAVIMPVRI